MNRITLAALAMSALLAGCATTLSPETESKRAELQRTTPVCVDEADCKAKWEAAQLWIVKNAHFKLQIISGVLLQTYSATGGTTHIAVQATKEPIGDGKYEINVSVSCDNLFGCMPNAWDAALDFNRVVGAAGDK